MSRPFNPVARWLAPALCAAVLLGCQTPAPAPPSAPAKSEVRAQALKQLGFVPGAQAEVWELSLGVKLLFETDVDAVSTSGQEALREVARTLGRIGIDKVRVEGHTDNVGPRRYNDGLSRRRAESVAQELVRAGLSARDIERLGHGPAKPVADNGTPTGRAQNRRVVITVLAE